MTVPTYSAPIIGTPESTAKFLPDELRAVLAWRRMLGILPNSEFGWRGTAFPEVKRFGVTFYRAYSDGRGGTLSTSDGSVTLDLTTGRAVINHDEMNLVLPLYLINYDAPRVRAILTSMGIRLHSKKD